ncbi:DUF2800 domain-containing protein [Candidatus Dependentiae bacterium]|nr:MAG: DUF2800 domain-containing protein [Candidatus Dependentiae bacterium]
MDTGVRTHRRYSPSQAERVILCPGSRALIERTPERDRTTYAEEGDKAHIVLEAGLRTFATTASQALDASELCFETFDDSFMSAIQEALDYIWFLYELMQSQYGDVQMFVEVYVNPPVASAPGEAGGYCDIALFSKAARKLWVIDYKHGIGVVKEAIDNSQANQYAAGFMFGDQEAKVDADMVDEVTLVIVQPRAFHPKGTVREFNTTPAAVFDYLLWYDDCIAKAEAEDAPLNPGLEQCQFCPARAVCPALERSALTHALGTPINSIKDLGTVKLPDPKTLDVNRLSFIKQSFDMLRLYMRSVDQQIEELERKGIDVPGWKMVQTQAVRHWYGDEDERITKLAALIGCNRHDLYDTKPKGITDVEKMIVDAFKQRVGRSRKKQAAEDAKQMFAFFTTKHSSGNLTLVEDSDPRPAANLAQISFGQIADATKLITNQGA